MYYGSETVDRIASGQLVLNTGKYSGRWVNAACALTTRHHFSV